MYYLFEPKTNQLQGTGCPRKKLTLFAHFPSKSANKVNFFLGHPVGQVTERIGAEATISK